MIVELIVVVVPLTVKLPLIVRSPPMVPAPVVVRVVNLPVDGVVAPIAVLSIEEEVIVPPVKEPPVIVPPAFVPAVTRPLASTVTLEYEPAMTPLFASVRAMALSAEPSKEAEPVASPLMDSVRAVDSLSADVALPVRAAVIVPAEKLPDASRATIAEAVLALVAFDVTVGLPATPSAFDTDRPVPDTAMERVVATPSAVRAIMPIVARPARAVRSLSLCWALIVARMAAASASSSRVRAKDVRVVVVAVPEPVKYGRASAVGVTEARMAPVLLLTDWKVTAVVPSVPPVSDVHIQIVSASVVPCSTT